MILAPPSLIPLISIEATSSFTFAEETVTIASFEEVQSRSFTLAFAGVIFTLKLLLSPSVILKPSSGIIVTGSIPVMKRNVFTVTAHSAVYFFPAAVVAVTIIRHEPGLIAVTSPSEETTAIASLLDCHV